MPRGRAELKTGLKPDFFSPFWGCLAQAGKGQTPAAGERGEIAPFSAGNAFDNTKGSEMGRGGGPGGSGTAP